MEATIAAVVSRSCLQRLLQTILRLPEANRVVCQPSMKQERPLEAPGKQLGGTDLGTLY